jgi:ABC-2 type transport system permease protein
MSTFLFFQPTIMLSGFVFPIQNMPEAIQYLTYLNPLRYFLVVIRGIFLKGNGLAILWPEILALLGIGGLVFAVSVLRFRRTLE